MGRHSAVSAQVKLNEFLADPVIDWNSDGSVSSKTDEWVEVINAGVTTVDLSQYRLGDASGGYVWRFAFSGALEPGRIAIVYGSDAVAWQAETGYPSYGLSLNNSGDTVTLYRIAGPDTLVEDSYSYAAFEALDDRSVGRESDGVGSWVLFDGLNPYSGATPPLGTGCNPSPGYANGCATPASATTWGSIKAQYTD
ncbi:MAG: lamin tail domain-containing protein [Chitinivibrionia bacterium]|nr:lamin tail domain-containing protein [Chitinivibrionia bacterium]